MGDSFLKKSPHHEPMEGSGRARPVIVTLFRLAVNQRRYVRKWACPMVRKGLRQRQSAQKRNMTEAGGR